MTYNPNSVTIKNKSLKRRSGLPLYNGCTIGQASGQTVGTVVQYTLSTISNAGRGPAVDSAWFMLNNGAQSWAIASTAQLASEAFSTVTVYHLNGSGAGTITVSGTPVDEYLLNIQVVTTGSNSTAILRWSFDDGQTWSANTTAAASITLTALDGTSTGLMLALTGTTGAFVAGDVYALAIHTSQSETTDATTGSLQDCLNKAVAFSDFSFILLTNQPNKSTDSANMTAFSAQLAKALSTVNTAVASGKYIRLFGAAPRRVSTLPALLGTDMDTTYAGLAITNVSALGDRLSGLGGGYFMTHSTQGHYAWRPVSWIAIAQLLQSANPRHSIYRWADGSLAGYITTPASPPTYTIQDYTQRPIMHGFTYDESLTSSTSTLGLLGPAGFLTLTSNTRRNEQNVAPEKQVGFTAANAHTNTNSDFFEMQYGILADVFLRVLADGIADLHGEELLTTLDGSGQLTNMSADMAENTIVSDHIDPLIKKGFLRALPADQKYVNIHRDNNVYSTGILYDAYCPVGVYGRTFLGTFQLAL